jgi:hypothetical protein
MIARMIKLHEKRHSLLDMGVLSKRDNKHDFNFHTKKEVLLIYQMVPNMLSFDGRITKFKAIRIGL